MDAPEMEDAAAGGERDLLMAKLSEVAGWFGEVRGGEGEITRVSSIESADERSLVFATDRKAMEQALRSGAGVVLVSGAREGEPERDPRVLEVKDAKLAFAIAADRLRPPVKSEEAIHVTATVEAGAVLGTGTRVGAGAVIGRCVRVGSDCEIHARVTIVEGTVLGDRVVVQSGAVLGSTGFGYVRDAETGRYVRFPQQGTLEIGDDVEIGANTTIDRGALGPTKIGRGTKIDNLVHIAHNCVIGSDVVIAAQTGISGSTVVEDGAVIGGQVGIGDHATIGEGVILGSGSGVLSRKKLRGPGQVFWGIPAQPLREYLQELARRRRE